MMRLDKYLSDMGVGTRTQVKDMVKKGRVTVDGVIATRPDQKVDEGSTRVAVDGRTLDYARHEYYMLNKPAGVLSAANDPAAVTVVDLIHDAGKKGLFPVGRLDKDTTGLMLITDDGALSHRLLSPKRHVAKTYVAKVQGMPDENTVLAFANGLDINICKCGDDELEMHEPELYHTLPARLEVLSRDAEDGSECLVTLHEGKFHQVKRMFLAVGMKVVSLKRLSMGALRLDAALAPGDYRRLTQEEVKSLENEGEMPGLGHMLEGIEGVVFDMDGTLLDSMYVWKEIDDEFLGKRGLVHTADMTSEIEGMSFNETAVYFKERFALGESLDEIKAEWNQAAYVKYSQEIGAKPGAVEFVRRLKDMGIRLGIATSNSRSLSEACLEHLGIRQLFDAVVTGDDVDRGKPNPEIYLKAAAGMGVPPEACLVFEDVVMGLQAGILAGMKTCGVHDEMSVSAEQKKRSLADYYIMSFVELLQEGE